MRAPTQGTGPRNGAHITKRQKVSQKGCHNFLLVSQSEISEAKGCHNFFGVVEKNMSCDISLCCSLYHLQIS